MAEIRFVHTLNNLKFGEVYNNYDPNFPGAFPVEDTRGAEFLKDIPQELRKVYNSTYFPELQTATPVANEQQAREQDDLDEHMIKYYRAKWDFYMRTKLDQLRVSHRQLEEAATQAAGPHGKDAQVARRAEFMYSFFDYDNDRARVRDRFLNEQHKKITLKDIGSMLDKFLLDERAESLRYLDPSEDAAKVPSASKDTSSFEMSWTGRLFRDNDPLRPLLMDDPSSLDGMPEDIDTPYRDILERIRYEDSRTDNSTMTKDEQKEVALFHSLKQDPYFKHFLHNHLRQFAEDIDEGILNFPEGPFTKQVTDIPKFDRINLYDFRRALPQKEREASLDGSGAAWGFGKRKTSRAVVRVKPGKGTIHINGMPMLDYFTMPSQRYRILLPLMITQYTCLLDVDIWVHGGGLTG